MSCIIRKLREEASGTDVANSITARSAPVLTSYSAQHIGRLAVAGKLYGSEGRFCAPDSNHLEARAEEVAQFVEMLSFPQRQELEGLSHHLKEVNRDGIF